MAKEKLASLKDSNVVLVLGNTGCGKSTLLSSLVYGPQNLEIKTDPLNKKAKVIDKIPGLSGFHIGHNQSRSETFFPDFMLEPVSNVIFGDIAGLVDTKGPVTELVHIFMNKLIFNKACFVRFIVPITKFQLENSRGQEVISQIKVIQNMINDDASKFGDSILPIITKCDPNRTDFDLETTIGTLMNQIENHVKNIETQASKKFNDQK